MQCLLKRVVMMPMPGTTFPYKEHPDSEVKALVMLGSDDKPNMMLPIRCEHVLAIHKCIGQIAGPSAASREGRAMNAIPPRRSFLRGLAALPLFGGATLSTTALLADAKPSEVIAPDRAATLDDYAAAEFDALKIDLGEARGAHARMWTPLAISLKLLTKTPNECRDLFAQMEDDEEVVKSMLESFSDGAAWYRQAAELIESAEMRYLSGAARLMKEDE